MKKILLGFTALVMSFSVFAKTHLVEIKQFRFVPAEITAEVGDAVQFINLDSAPHSVVPDANSANQFQASGIMQTNDEFELMIDDETQTDVKCGVHPRMPGMTINVLSEELSLINEIEAKLDLLKAKLQK